MAPSPDRRHLFWLWGLIGLAIVARSVSWLRTAVMFDDGPLFLTLAEAIGQGEWGAVLLHPFHPLYPLLTWMAGGVFGNYEVGAVTVSVLSGGVAVAALVALLRSAFDAPTAYAGGAILAVHPFAVDFSADVQSDGLYMALFLTSVTWLWRGLRDRRPIHGAGAGLAAGLAYLTRPEGIGLVIVGAVLATALTARGRWSTAPALRWLAALGLGFALVAAPYALALRAETGQWMLTQKKSMAELVGLDAPPAASGGIITLPALPRASDARTIEPDTLGQRMVRAVSEVYLASISSLRFVILAFLVLGLWQCRGRPELRGVFLATLVGFYAVVLWLLGFGAGYVSRRHALPPLLPLLGYVGVGVPLLGGWILTGLSRLWHHDSARGGPRGGRAVAAGRQRPAALAIGMIVVAAVILPRGLREKRPDRLAERQAAEWLRDQHLPGPIAAGRPRIAYYAGEPFVPLPSGPKDGMLAYLRGHGARYVIVDEGKLDEHQGLREAQGQGLRLMHRENAAGRSAAVFEVEAAEVERGSPP